MPSDRSREQRFRDLYAAHFHALTGYALRRAAPADAADAVAESLLIAWRRLEEVPPGETARLWLYATARRVLANQRRADARRTRLSERLALELETLTARDEQQAAHEVAAAAAAFRRLSDADRDLLGLVAWEGLAPAGLARVLGCSTNAAKIRVYRARRRFERELARAAGEPKPNPRPGHSPEARTVLPARSETS